MAPLLVVVVDAVLGQPQRDFGGSVPGSGGGDSFGSGGKGGLSEDGLGNGGDSPASNCW